MALLKAYENPLVSLNSFSPAIQPGYFFLGGGGPVDDRHDSGDSWMYPYQRTLMGNPYISPIYPYNTWVFMGYYPQESLYFRPISTMGGYKVRQDTKSPLLMGGFAEFR